MADTTDTDIGAATPAGLIHKPPTAIGLMPATVDEAWRLATIMAKADLVPKNYKDKPADVMVAIMYGAEVGLTPAQAMAGIYVANGRPALYGDALLGVIMNSPLYAGHDEFFTVAGGGIVADVTAADLLNPTTAAVCTFRRHGAADRTRQFSVEDARRAKLIGKPGPWTEYPQVMLRMRARGFAARDAFPDVLRGLHTAEELIDISPPAPAAAPMVRRVSETPPPAPPEDPPEDPAPESTELTGRIVNVAPHANGDDAIVTLSTGVRVVVADLPSAHALAGCLTTDRIVHLTVTRGAADELVLATYRIED